MSLEDALHAQGFGSRRECRALVRLGRVRVAGAPVEDPDAALAELMGEAAQQDWALEVDGRHWPYRERAVVMLHKPAGYECSLKPRHHPSVMSLLPTPLRLRGLQPIGRLDEDTTGLLLLTDDGELNHRLTSPKWHAPKLYRVQCRHPWTDEASAKLLAGVVLDDDPQALQALAVQPLSPAQAHGVLLTIGEGRYHQVKRMVAAVGNRVDGLQRVRMGTLNLDPGLAAGQWRWLQS
ncbi:MAG: pseudouridine synthase, partial [Betaproteobacteria bacterium]